MEDKMIMAEQLQRYYMLWRESNAMYEDWSKAHGLSLNSVLILYSFHEDEVCTQKMISQKWVIAKQTVNTILKDFEKQGFVRLIPIDTDKRNKLIRLTPEGKQFADTIISELHTMELYVMDKMGSERMTSLNDNLELFIKLFRQGGGE